MTPAPLPDPKEGSAATPLLARLGHVLTPTRVSAAIVGLFIAAMILVAAAPGLVHFDGALGYGCDAGNPRCTYSEWAKRCTEETSNPTPARCRFIYDAESGRAK